MSPVKSLFSLFGNKLKVLTKAFPNLIRVKPQIVAFDSSLLWKAESYVAEAAAEVAGVA
jgi:hypothetical protein